MDNLEHHSLWCIDTQIFTYVGLMDEDKTCGACEEDGPWDICSGCSSVAYCSIECQKTDWKATHKTECPLLAELRNKYIEKIKEHEEHADLCTEIKCSRCSIYLSYVVGAYKRHNVELPKIWDEPGLFSYFLSRLGNGKFKVKCVESML